LAVTLRFLRTTLLFFGFVLGLAATAGARELNRLICFGGTLGFAADFLAAVPPRTCFEGWTLTRFVANTVLVVFEFLDGFFLRAAVDARAGAGVTFDLD
jgi:hypothetical protein